MDAILKDGEIYLIKVVAGTHEGITCEAVYYDGFSWFEGIEPNDITVLLSCVQVLGLGLEALQEQDLANIAERGQSFNLYDMAKHEYYKNGEWRDVPRSQSLYELALADIQVRKKITA